MVDPLRFDNSNTVDNLYKKGSAILDQIECFVSKFVRAIRQMAGVRVSKHDHQVFIYLFYLLTDICYTPFHVNTTEASAVNVI